MDKFDIVDLAVNLNNLLENNFLLRVSTNIIIDKIKKDKQMQKINAKINNINSIYDHLNDLIENNKVFINLLSKDKLKELYGSNCFTDFNDLTNRITDLNTKKVTNEEINEIYDCIENTLTKLKEFTNNETFKRKIIDLEMAKLSKIDDDLTKTIIKIDTSIDSIKPKIKQITSEPIPEEPENLGLVIDEIEADIIPPIEKTIEEVKNDDIDKEIEDINRETSETDKLLKFIKLYKNLSKIKGDLIRLKDRVIEKNKKLNDKYKIIGCGYYGMEKYVNIDLNINIMGTAQPPIDLNINECAKIWQERNIKYYINFNPVGGEIIEKNAFEKICTGTDCKYYYLPVVDYQPPTKDTLLQLWKILDEYHNLLKSHSRYNILMHCTIGHGRTGFMIVSYIWLKKIFADPTFKPNYVKNGEKSIIQLVNEYFNCVDEVCKNTIIYKVKNHYIIQFLICQLKVYSKQSQKEVFEECPIYGEHKCDLLMNRLKVFSEALSEYMAPIVPDIQEGSNYKDKYLKYKSKYFNLKHLKNSL